MSKLFGNLRSTFYKFLPPPFLTAENAFLYNASGLIHVGGNTGQERFLYGRLGFKVLWIEAIPNVFDQLSKNIGSFPNQRCLQALVSAKDGQRYDFYISNNDGLSSSIFELKHHKDIWPDVKYTSTIELVSLTLPSLLDKNKIGYSDYNALVMDAQGAELLILEGLGNHINHFKYIKTEASDFESYKGACTADELKKYVKKYGFEQVVKAQWANHPTRGQYYEIVFEQK